MLKFEQVIYDAAEPGIVRVVLNRAEARNAQDTRMLYELNDALDLAAQDDDVKVIVIAANGPHFSAGHDLREKDPVGTQQSFKLLRHGAVLRGKERKGSSPESRRFTWASVNAGAIFQNRPWSRFKVK